MQELVTRGRTSNLFHLFLPDSASASGGGKTGLTHESAGLIIAVRRELSAAFTVYTAAGSTVETITTLGTFSAPSASKCRFKEADSTNAPGAYELQLADAILDASDGSRFLIGMVQATGIAPTPFRIPLVAVDHQDGVRAGLTALPNAAAEAAGGLYTRGTGAGQINQPANGEIDTNLVKWRGTQPNTLTSGRVEVLVGAITNGVLAAASFAAGALDAVWSTATRILTAATNITSTGGTTVPQTGDSFARLGAPAGASVSADVAAVKAQTAEIETDTQDLQGRLPAALTGAGNIKADALVVSDKTGYGLADDAITAAKIAADAIGASELAAGAASEIATAVRTELATELARVDAAVSTRATPAQVATELATYDAPTKAELDAAVAPLALEATAQAIQAKTDNLPSDPADQSLIIAATDALVAAIAALHNLSAADVLAQINAALDESVPDAIPADGSRPSLRQAAYMQTQFLVERSVSGTTVTVKKPDGVTTLFTLTLNDATAPTSTTRAA